MFYFQICPPIWDRKKHTLHGEEHIACTKRVLQQKDPSLAALTIRHLSYDKIQGMFSTAACRSEDQTNITSSESESSTSLTRTEESKPKNTESKRLQFGAFFLL